MAPPHKACRLPRDLLNIGSLSGSTLSSNFWFSEAPVSGANESNDFPDMSARILLSRTPILRKPNHPKPRSRNPNPESLNSNPLARSIPAYPYSHAPVYICINIYTYTHTYMYINMYKNPNLPVHPYNPLYPYMSLST